MQDTIAIDTLDTEEIMPLYSEPGVDDYPAGGNFVFAVAMVTLACHFYALPFITSPLGYITNMRIDDIALGFVWRG